MATIDLGKIKPVWKGTWVGGTTYEKNDTVRNGTTSYICKEDHTADASTFANDSAKWDVMAEGVEFPSVSGNAGKYLTNDGTNPSWEDVVIPSGATVASSELTANVTLTNESDLVQSLKFDAANYKVNLPSATTLTENDGVYVISNTGLHTFQILDYDGSPVTIVKPGKAAHLDLKDNTTTAGSWDAEIKSDKTLINVIAEHLSNKTFGIYNQRVSALSATRFIVTYSRASSGAGNQTFYAQAFEFDGVDITEGTAVQVYTIAATWQEASIWSCKANSNSVFAVINNYDGSNYKIRHCVISAGASGTSLTVGTITEHHSSTYCITTDVVYFEDNKVMFGYFNDPSANLRIHLYPVSISGTTATTGSGLLVSVDNGGNPSYTNSTCRISPINTTDFYIVTSNNPYASGFHIWGGACTTSAVSLNTGPADYFYLPENYSKQVELLALRDGVAVFGTSGHDYRAQHGSPVATFLSTGSGSSRTFSLAPGGTIGENAADAIYLQSNKTYGSGIKFAKLDDYHFAYLYYNGRGTSLAKVYVDNNGKMTVVKNTEIFDFNFIEGSEAAYKTSLEAIDSSTLVISTRKNGHHKSFYGAPNLLVSVIKI